MIEYTFVDGPHNVFYLRAPYALLVEAFGNDGDGPRDTEKMRAWWGTGHAQLGMWWEVYDYAADQEDGLALEQITEWHCQADANGRAYLEGLLEGAKVRANAGLSRFIVQHPPLTQTPRRNEDAAEVAAQQRVTDAVGVLGKYQALIDHRAKVEGYLRRLRAGETVRIGAEDADGLWIDGGIEVVGEHCVRVGVGMQEDGLEEISVGLTGPESDLDAVREAHALLEAYLRLHDTKEQES